LLENKGEKTRPWTLPWAHLRLGGSSVMLARQKSKIKNKIKIK
jgi:hypothetical protein